MVSIDYTDEEKVELLHSYGIRAPISGIEGNNFHKMWRHTHKELSKIETLFGFYMDKQLNCIGNTGWDFVKGEIGFKSKNN